MIESIRMIPLSKLVPASANVRKTAPETGLDELVASIATHGLLQNLTVRSVRKPNGRLSNLFEVIAGGRRLAALKRLAEEGRITSDQDIPCHVLDEGNPVEVSMAENVVRAPLHPADQFEAFAALYKEGLGAEEIAGRFGISPLLVQQRLKLAAVSPRLMVVYREGGMTLDQLMAFTISDDQEAQERVWFEGPLHTRDQHGIRRGLTKALVEGTDRRARFVGAEAYEAAGGTIVRDLFRSEHDGYFTDSALLERLANEKVQALAEQVKAEGWAWVEILPEPDYGYLARFGRVDPVPAPLSEEAEATRKALAERYDALIEELGENPPQEIAEELDRLSEEMDALEKQEADWVPSDMAQAGVVIALDYQGTLRIERGLLKREGDATGSRKKKRRRQEGNGMRAEVSELPHDLVIDLSAHRTAALRAVLADKPDLALTALVHTLAMSTFYDTIGATCIDLKRTAIDLREFAQGIGESKAALKLAELHAAWRSKLPDGEGSLWAWLLGQSLESRLSLLAYCVATVVNGVENRYGGYSERFGQADQLAEALALDMAEWWEPSKDRFLNRLTKKQILTAVIEAVSREEADTLASLKKGAMVLRAEQLLMPRRWLPKELRTAEAIESAAIGVA